MEGIRLTVTVEEAGHMLGIGRNLAYEMANSGRLPVLRFGRRLVVSLPALERMLEKAPRGQAPLEVALTGDDEGGHPDEAG